MEPDVVPFSMSPRKVYQTFLIVKKCSNFRSNAEITGETLLIVCALYGQTIQVALHLLRRHTVAVVDDAQLKSTSGHAEPINIPLDNARSYIARSHSASNGFNRILR